MNIMIGWYLIKKASGFDKRKIKMFLSVLKL